MTERSGTFRVLLTVQVRPGMEADFEKVWAEGGKEVTAQPANLGHTLARGAGDGEGSVYYVVSDWTDRESFLGFERSPEHVRHREKLHPYRTGGSLATMHLVEVAG
ncbi:antibiotic biosynthesis monooxygenase [Streptomyces spongiicola]|uniref:Antibiotic biosynthesis monooxygenase n=1 Tax=Streptomyces spongiicola TaxID=1690221 RepID=A0A388STI9_9ACTN|nr:antibiotic biosynthesis monooxygenase family protein [Streptomyces spongiicola]GBP99896.1 antibiotic biosynthesis monooxygenase [Streptomyces spongiicola]